MILLNLFACFLLTDDHVADTSNMGTPPVPLIQEGDLEDILGEDAVCFTIITATREVKAVGMDSGTWADVAVIPDGKPHSPAGVHSIARQDHYLYWCGKEELGRLDLTNGALDTVPVECQAISDVGGRLVVSISEAPFMGEHTMYDDWAAVQAGNGTLLPAAEIGGYRLGRVDGAAVRAWHSAEDIELLNADFSVGNALVLTDWDTWIWGVSGAGQRLFLLDDGRGDVTPGITRIGEFTMSGAPVASILLAERLHASGLTCSGALDPLTFQDLDPSIGTGPITGN